MNVSPGFLAWKRSVAVLVVRDRDARGVCHACGLHPEGPCPNYGGEIPPRPAWAES